MQAVCLRRCLRVRRTDFIAATKCSRYTTCRHLKRAISAMEGTLPPNYPELGDFYAAVAEALTALIDERGEALPQKLKNQTARCS